MSTVRPKEMECHLYHLGAKVIFFQAFSSGHAVALHFLTRLHFTSWIAVF